MPGYESYSKEALIEEIKKLKKTKKYGLVWDETKVHENLEDKIPVLVEDTSRAISNGDGPVNLLIEGENYYALEALLFTHKEKVDVIYIDPPYNTGNGDFRYNDTFVDKEDTYRHSKWLAFMLKRLSIARNLLSLSGIILIHISDQEVAQLKLLCDQVFGEENLIGIMLWKNKHGGATATAQLTINAEYILVYGKIKEYVQLNKRNIADPKEYKFTDARGSYKLRRLDQPSLYTKQFDFEIEVPADPNLFYRTLPPTKKTVIIPGGNGRTRPYRWLWSKKTIEAGYKNKTLLFRRSGDEYTLSMKEYLLIDNKTLLPRPKEYPYSNLILEFPNTEGTKGLLKIFNKSDTFPSPKPLNLVMHLLRIVSQKNSIILDFFAGSGTTGQAVLELNKEDGGNREFILVTNNENNICRDVCYPRIKKVSIGYKSREGNHVPGLGGNLKYYTMKLLSSDDTDDNKETLVTSILSSVCVKEKMFERLAENPQFSILSNGIQNIGIFYSDDNLKNIVTKYKLAAGYVFTYSHSLSQYDVIIPLFPIPSSLINIHKEVKRHD